MALWQHDESGERFDDGLTAQPGEEGFTRELAQAHFGTDRFSYVGTPNWVPPQEADAPADPDTPA